jgi:ubiquitin thioesterase CYLD
VPFNVAEDQFTEGRHEQIQRYIGDRKGIQGHENSCYLDASIFGLFALTDAFDELFLKAESSKTADQNRKAIADLLWKGIVNPLRKYVHVHVHAFKVVEVNVSCYRNGVVRYESVMALRTKLDELGRMEGIAHAEKGCSLTVI